MELQGSISGRSSSWDPKIFQNDTTGVFLGSQKLPFRAEVQKFQNPPTPCVSGRRVRPSTTTWCLHLLPLVSSLCTFFFWFKQPDECTFFPWCRRSALFSSTRSNVTKTEPTTTGKDFFWSAAKVTKTTPATTGTTGKDFFC